MDDVASIQRRARHWRDPVGHDKAFALQVFMHGDVSAIIEGKALDSYAPNRMGNGDLPDYGEIELPLGPMGIQNHGEINSRINIQGMIHVDPVISITSDDPIFIQTNQGWWRQSWQDADWGSQYYLAGMEFEAQGIGAVEYGPDDPGAAARIVCHHRPYLDTIKDRMYPSPNQWRGVFHRRRIDFDEATEKYGHIYTEKQIKEFMCDMFPIRQGGRTGSKTWRADEERIPVIHEWHYQDAEHECFFLRSIQQRNIVCWDDNMELKKLPAGSEKIGPNHNGFIPWAWWVDSYLPSCMNPRGKSETTIRLASMLNEIENYMVQVLQRGLQITAFNEKCDKKLLDAVKAAKGSKDISKLFAITGAGDVRELFSKLPPDEVPQTAIAFRGILKDELNAATGVMDMQRGQELQRDRVTRYEVSQLVSKQGVQANHVRQRFARFLEQGFQISRALGALWDDLPRIIPLEEGTIDTAAFPIKAHLSAPCIAKCDPEMMRYISEDEKRQRAIEELQAVKRPAIELGVADPYRTFYRLYQQIGYKDPVAEGLLSPAEWQMVQQQMAMMQALGIGQNGEEQQNGSSRSSQSSGSSGSGSQPGR